MSELGEASRRAAAFLLGSQDADGGWRDFNLYKGIATSWTTAHVATALAAAVGLDDRIPAASEAAAGFLSRHREASGGWAYNARCMADADSTALALIFLTGRVPRPNLKDVAVLASFQRADGGFATYRHLPATHPWGASHAEVTPTALRALAPFLAEDHAILRSGRDWLARHAGRDEAVYWWTTPEYLRLEMARLGAPMARGSADIPCGEVFSTALAIERSILAGGPKHVVAVRYLLERQCADGSWPSTPILLVPDPNARPGSAAARTGHGYADQNRTFTTATVLSALNVARSSRGAAGSSARTKLELQS